MEIWLFPQGILLIKLTCPVVWITAYLEEFWFAGVLYKSSDSGDIVIILQKKKKEKKCKCTINRKFQVET